MLFILLSVGEFIPQFINIFFSDFQERVQRVEDNLFIPKLQVANLNIWHGTREDFLVTHLASEYLSALIKDGL